MVEFYEQIMLQYVNVFNVCPIDTLICSPKCSGTLLFYSGMGVHYNKTTPEIEA